MSRMQNQNYGTANQTVQSSGGKNNPSQLGHFQSIPMQSQKAADKASGASDEIRKAAILIDSLDDDSRRLFLRKLNLSTAREIHQLAKDLGQVTKEEKESVLSEFLKTIQQVSSSEKA